MAVDIFYIGFSIFIFNFHDGLAVPHEYCLSPLNSSDCGLPPTPVFSYYKPGSRCEIEYWRGCPTTNKFSDEFLCSHTCIGKLFGFTQSIEEENDKLNFSEDQCSKPLDKGDCGSKPTTVYTYDGHCQQAVWRGCPSFNKFDNYTDCIQTCEPSFDDWKGEIETLDLKVVEKIDNLLDDVMEIVQKQVPENETKTAKKEKMALPVKPEPSADEETTTAVTEVEETTTAVTEAEETTEAPAPEETTKNDSGNANETVIP